MAEMKTQQNSSPEEPTTDARVMRIIKHLSLPALKETIVRKKKLLSEMMKADHSIESRAYKALVKLVKDLDWEITSRKKQRSEAKAKRKASAKQTPGVPRGDTFRRWREQKSDSSTSRDELSKSRQQCTKKYRAPRRVLPPRDDARPSTSAGLPGLNLAYQNLSINDTTTKSTRDEDRTPKKYGHTFNYY